MGLFVAGIVGIAGFLGAAQTIGDGISSAWSYVFAPGAAEEDASKLNGVRAGQLVSAFERSLGTEPVAIVSDEIIIEAGTDGLLFSDGLVLRDQLYVLDTVFIEAFIDSKGNLAAYTITARSSPMPVLRT